MLTNVTPESATRTLPRLLDQVWLDPRIGTGLAVGVAALAGWVISRVMPHGPATAAQALTVMLMALVVGLIAGSAMPSRWAMLLAPLAHILMIEIMNRGVAGPSVGAIRLDNLFGILALVLGRGFYALVGLLPMIFGASLGVMGSQVTHRPTSLLAWLPTGVIGVGLIVFAVVIMLPASTPPIVGADGKPLAGSIARLEKLRLGGADQWIMIRALQPRQTRAALLKRRARAERSTLFASDV